MDFTSPLNEVLRSATNVRVLRALFEIPRGFGVSAREVARRADVAHPSASKVLSVLVQQGIVSARRTARFDEYALNYENVLTSALSTLFGQEQRLVEDLRWTLRAELTPLGVTSAYLFGSVAHGDSTTKSDIDLAIEPPLFGGEQFGTAIDTIREKIRKKYGNELNVIMRNPATPKSDAMWRRFTKDAIAIFDKVP